MTEITFKDIHPKIFIELNDLTSQDHLRATCHYWKKTGDTLQENNGILHLLHSLADSTTKTKARILFYATYNNNYFLIKHILESTPNKRLYLKDVSGWGGLDPYDIALDNKNENVLKLFLEHDYHKCNYGIDKYNQKISCRKWPETLILQEFLLACISGDNIALKEITNIKFKQKEILATILDPELDEKTFTDEAENTIEDAFYIVVHNDDERSILSFLQFVKDNPEYNFLIRLLLIEACEKNKMKAFIKLLENKQANINKIDTCYINDQKRKLTLRDELIEMSFRKYKSKKHYDHVTTLLNLYGAKTFEELQLKNQSLKQKLLGYLKSHYFIRLFFLEDIPHHRCMEQLLQHLYSWIGSSFRSYMEHLQ
jgi:hypothetical protein